MWIGGVLGALGFAVSHVLVVGDEAADLREALELVRGAALVVTSGGLGPTADDLTAEVVGAFAGAPLELDEAMEKLDTVDDVADALATALVERPPALAREGALFVAGFDTELDEADALAALEGESRY